VFYRSHIWLGSAFSRHFGIAMRQLKRKMPASPDDFSIEEGLFGLACRRVGPRRHWSASAPFGERCQAIVFFRHLEQASLVLDGIGG
jgi:hypothetical protein